MCGIVENKASNESLPLVLLPGTLCDARIFDPLICRLPRIETHVIQFVGARTMRQAAEHVLQHAPERFALLGFSLGGMVAMEVALLAPERVVGLVLLSTTPLPVPPERHATRRAALDEADSMPMGEFARTRLWPDYAGPIRDAADRDPALILIENMAESLGCAVFRNQTEMALQRPDYRPLLPSIQCPTLVIAGAQDRICPPGAQGAFAAALPNCSLCTIPDTGHLALLQKPDDVASPVAAWFHTMRREQVLQAPTPSQTRQKKK